jgi:hypothetical protein
VKKLLLAAIFTLLCISTAFANKDAINLQAKCQDQALFVYSIAKARDDGLPRTQVKQAVEKLSTVHAKDYGLNLDEMPFMLTLVDWVYSSQRSAEMLQDETLVRCMQEKEA